MKGLFLYGFLLIIVLSGCTTKNVDERTTELKIIVAKYNNALIEAYKNQHFEPLMEVAVEDEVRRIDITVSAYLQANQLMEADLHKIDFKYVSIEVDKATIVTSEDWSYRWIDYKTKQEIEPLSSMQYGMRYYLIRRGAQWFIEKTEEVKEGEKP